MKILLATLSYLLVCQPNYLVRIETAELLGDGNIGQLNDEEAGTIKKNNKIKINMKNQSVGHCKFLASQNHSKRRIKTLYC